MSVSFCQEIRKWSGRMNVTWWIRSWFNFVPLTKLLTLDIYCFCFVLCSDSTVSLLFKKTVQKEKMCFLLQKKNEICRLICFSFFYIFPLFKINFYLNGVKSWKWNCFSHVAHLHKGDFTNQTIYICASYKHLWHNGNFFSLSIILMNIFSSLHFYQ